LTLVLDAGGLLLLEANDRDAVASVKQEFEAGRSPVTHGGIVGQVWRGGSGRQATLAALLKSLDIKPLDDGLGRRAGVLLGKAGQKDVLDAALVLLAQDGDEIWSSDLQDLQILSRTSGIHLDIVPV
jgi:hypothetical protein